MTTFEHLAQDLAKVLGVEVSVAPGSLDACVALCRSQGRRVVLSPGHDPVREATLLAAVQRTQTTVLCGAFEELAGHAQSMAQQVGPGRLVRAWEWLQDPEAVRFGRRNAAFADLPQPARTLAESPLSPSPRVYEALQSAIDSFQPQRYPPMAPDALVEVIAGHHGVSPDQVVVSGAGSVELLQRVLRACTDVGDEVQAFAPTFDRLPSLCAQEGLVLRLTKEPVAATSARLVYAVTPNGPDLKILDVDALTALRRSLSPDRVLVVDRAYAHLDEPDPIALDAEGPVVVLRTLSKAGALAGLRIGWAVAPVPVANLLRRFAVPYGVTSLSAQCARAVLEDVEHRRTTREALDRVREQLAAELTRRGFEILGGYGHLLCVRAPEAQRAIIEADDSLPFQPVEGEDGVFTVAVSRPA